MPNTAVEPGAADGGEPTAAAFLRRAEALFDRLEAWLPPVPVAPDWLATAFRWRRQGGRGVLAAVPRPHRIALDALLGIDRQKALLDRNTRQFVRGLPANNALLTGARGTGKSSLIKALLNEYAPQGLRLIEVERQDLVDLPDLAERLAGRPERFLVFCDDLTFDADDPGYRALKVALDGSVAAAFENLLIYATSNRRHLMPEYVAENLEATHVGEEIHPGEAVEEKISLSERFGLWLSFRPFTQDQYLVVAAAWIRHLHGGPIAPESYRQPALTFALARGSRSGRVAWQFARDWVGRLELGE